MASSNVTLCRCCLMLVILLGPSLFDVFWFAGSSDVGGGNLFANAECFSNQMNRMTRGKQIEIIIISLIIFNCKLMMFSAHLRILRKGGPYSQLADLIRTHNDCLIRDDKLRFKKSLNSIPQIEDNSKEFDPNSFEEEDRRKQQQNEEEMLKMKLVKQLLHDLARLNLSKQTMNNLKEQLNLLL